MSDAERDSATGKDMLSKIHEVKKEIKQLQSLTKKPVKIFEKGSFNALSVELANLKKQYKSLSEAQREAEGGKALLENIQSLDEKVKGLSATFGDNQRKVGSYRDEVMSALDSFFPLIGRLRENFSGLGSDISLIGASVSGAFIGFEVIGILMEYGQELKAIEEQYTQMRGAIQRYTGATNEDLDDLTTSATALSMTFDEESAAIADVANGLQVQFDSVSFDDALELLENGFVRGANAGGDFLEKVKEYSPQFDAADLSAQALINTITDESKYSIFKDKGVGSIKEFNLSIKEQTTATRDALVNAFGDDFTSKIFDGINDGSVTTGEALERIVKKIKETELPANKLQTIIADVFKGDGEDAGERFLLSLDNINVSTLDSIDTSNELVQKKQELLEANQILADAENELAKAIQGGATQFEVIKARVKSFILNGLVILISTLKPTIKLFANIILALTALPKFLNENKTVILGLSIAMVGLNWELAKTHALQLKSAASARLGIVSKRAGTIATRGAAAAQWLLNAALTANPIGLVIVAVGALVLIIVPFRD